MNSISAILAGGDPGSIFDFNSLCINIRTSERQLTTQSSAATSRTG